MPSRGATAGLFSQQIGVKRQENWKVLQIQSLFKEVSFIRVKKKKNKKETTGQVRGNLSRIGKEKNGEGTWGGDVLPN